MYSQAPSNISTSYNAMHWETIALIIFGALLAVSLLVALGVLFLNAITFKTKNQATDNKFKIKKIHWFFKYLFSILISCVVFFAGINFVEFLTNKTNTDGAKSILRRSADETDIIISQSIEFNLSDNYIIIPRADIKNLQVKIHFLDSSNQIISTKTKDIGNVKAKNKYTLSFSLSEFSATEILTIRYWNSEITGGTVSYFYH